MLRLIAFDLDGTLLDSTGQIPDRNKLALARAADRGVRIMLVSGRHHFSVAALHAGLGLRSPVICCNGAYIYDFAASEILLPSPLSPAAAHALIDRCRRAGLYFLVYTSGGMYYEPAGPGFSAVDIARMFPAAAKGRITGLDDVDSVVGKEAVFKLVAGHDEVPRLEALQRDVGAAGGYAAEFSWINRLDISAAANSKGRKLIEWAASQGILPAEIAAFGDQENDMSMLGAVGWGIAMGNAIAPVKAIARQTIGDNDGPDLAATVDRLVDQSA